MTATELRRLRAQWAAEDAYLQEIFGLKTEDAGSEPELTDSFLGWSPVRGGPPPAWDAWIQLPADLDCLGPTNADDLADDLKRQQRCQRRAEFQRPSRAVALSAWRREFRRGQRTATTFDALWAAAADEQQALENEQAGLPELARHFWASARRVLAKAAGPRAA